MRRLTFYMLTSAGGTKLRSQGLNLSLVFPGYLNIEDGAELSSVLARYPVALPPLSNYFGSIIHIKY